MIVQGPKRVATKWNNRILLCLKANISIIVFKFCNTVGCPLQQKSIRDLQNNKTDINLNSTRNKQLRSLNYVTSSSTFIHTKHNDSSFSALL